jgi:hypothetical protein
VELEGFEPSSKQAAKMLSTCLVSVGLSGAGWSETDLPEPYSLLSRPVAGKQTEPSQLLRGLSRNTVEKGFPGDQKHLISKIKQLIDKNNCRHLLAVRIGF